MKIKVRVWDRLTQSFLTSEISGSHPFHFIGGLEVYTIEPSHPDYIFQQFTGIKDRKGQKIFEGDIIKCPWHHNPKHYCVGEVVFWEGAFRLSKGPEKGYPELYPYDLYGDNDTPTRLYFWQNAEVIDNIFETKDLYRITAIAELSKQ